MAAGSSVQIAKEMEKRYLAKVAKWKEHFLKLDPEEVREYVLARKSIWCRIGLYFDKLPKLAGAKAALIELEANE